MNGAYCSMQLQMTLTSCVCEDKPGYVSSVNGQTGDVILDIPDIERTVIDVNGQTGHVVLDIPEKLSDLYQDIEYATPTYVDEKAAAEHNYTDSVKSNLKDEIGKLVTGVSSVNGSTGDVVIFIPKMTSDLENNSDFIDSEYVDNLIESLNSSIKGVGTPSFSRIWKTWLVILLLITPFPTMVPFFSPLNAVASSL